MRGNLEVVAGGGRQAADRVHPLCRLDVVADESPVAPSLFAVLDDEVEDGTAAVAPRVQPHRDRCGVDGKQLRGLGHHRGCRPQQRLKTQKSTSTETCVRGATKQNHICVSYISVFPLMLKNQRDWFLGQLCKTQHPNESILDKTHTSNPKSVT